jgi:hypothetical protein
MTALFFYKLNLAKFQNHKLIISVFGYDFLDKHNVGESVLHELGKCLQDSLLLPTHIRGSI